MDPIRTIRSQRLQLLLAEQFPGRGGQALLARALQRQTGYLSRCLSGDKAIGEAFARHIEQALHLPRYWLDGAHLEGSLLTARQAALLERFDVLSPGQQSEVLERLERTRRRNQEIYEHLRGKLELEARAAG